jgi:dTDP-glucose pyrophosphorylase
MTMKDWKNTLITSYNPIMEAMKIIDVGAMQIALVIDDDGRLIGVITDGDVRRGLLNGITLEQPVHLIMNKDFTVVSVNTSHEEILNLMKRKDLRQIPVVDDRGCVVNLKLLVDMIQLTSRDNWVVLMAGGLGSRLRPFTDECPKPLLQVGDKPLIETILENFVEHGFQKFFVSINYKGKMIEDSLGDGSRWGVTINYLREDIPLGTAGALGLLPDRPAHPLIVMNGDVLTKVNPQFLIEFHENHKAKATMSVRDYHFQIPYGVVNTDQHRLLGIHEKPLQQFFVNAGIYVLEPDVLELIPRNTCLDMPSLFEQLIGLGLEIVVFPIREYWIDIGQIDDFKRANGDYPKIFK